MVALTVVLLQFCSTRLLVSMLAKRRVHNLWEGEESIVFTSRTNHTLASPHGATDPSGLPLYSNIMRCYYGERDYKENRWPTYRAE